MDFLLKSKMYHLCALLLLLTISTGMPQVKNSNAAARSASVKPSIDASKTGHYPSDAVEEWLDTDLGLLAHVVGMFSGGAMKREEEKIKSELQKYENLGTYSTPATYEEYEAQEFSESDLTHVQDEVEGQILEESPDKSYSDDSSNVQDSTPDMLTPNEEESPESVTGLQYPADYDYSSAPLRSGSLEGIPGGDFPNYEDIPLSSFTCSDKEYVPGFYADMEAGCQVFHVCYENRRESFLCPIGTTFNQALLTCDFWHSSNCTNTPVYYNINAGIGHSTHGKVELPTDAKPGKEFQDTVVSKHENTHDVHDSSVQDHASSLGDVSGVDVSGKDHIPVEEVDYTASTVHSGSFDNGHSTEKLTPGTSHAVGTSNRTEAQYKPMLSPYSYLKLFLQFFPIKAKVSVHPVRGQTKVSAVASIGNIIKQRVSVYPVSNNSKVVAEASIGGRRRQRLPRKEYQTVPGVSITEAQRMAKDIDSSVFQDIDDAFLVVRRVLEQVGRLVPRTNVADDERFSSSSGHNRRYRPCRCRPSHGNHHHPGWPRRCSCHRPLTQLNPRFIVKPVKV